jgi:predicted Zn-ribbon and HTH transcriptional regulator
MSKIILIEGKKEDVAKKLKSKFVFDGPFIDRILNVDPTGYKYVDYIARQVEKIIPELSGPNGGLNYDQSTAIYDVFYQIIPWFHNNINKITSDDIWNTETKYRARHGVFDNINNLADNPKDINQYTNPAFLEELMDVVDNRKTKSEIEKELKNQAEKLYEDDDVLVVKPNTYAASCYYGANTKWCTTTKDSSHYFRQYVEKGSLYYFLNKKTGLKLALHINKNDGEKLVYDAADKEMTIKTLRESFPNQDDLIDEFNPAEKIIDTVQQNNDLEIIKQQFEISEEDAGRLWKILLARKVKNFGVSQLYDELKTLFKRNNLDIVSLNHFESTWIQPTSESLVPRGNKEFKVICDYLGLPITYRRIIYTIKNRTITGKRNATRIYSKLLKDLFNDGCFDENANPIQTLSDKIDYYKHNHNLDELGIDEVKPLEGLNTLIELIQPELSSNKVRNIEKNEQ